MRGAGWPGCVNGRSVLILGAVVVTLYALVMLTGTVLRPGGPMPADLLAFLRS